MSQTSVEQMRRWSGPAILSFGFRPFFLLGALWAFVAMVLWIGALAGALTLPTAFSPVDWHAHGFVMGYLSAIVAGFLLTAVPNWTGRLPVVGWRLGLLAALWALGRGAVLMSAHLPVLWVAVLDISCLLVLAAVMLREIVAGRNWRNLIVVAMVLALALGGALYHWQAAQGTAAQQSGLRLMLAAAVMMICVIGGRVIPSFTRNWLARTGRPARPAPPMARFDVISLLVMLMALVLWVAWPEARPTGLALMIVGVVHLWRLSRWSGHHTGSEALVWILHVGYLFVPLGAIGLGVAILWPQVLDRAAGQHLWMAGAIGVMTLAMMTRATLGHSGRALHAGAGSVVIYLAIVASVLVRLLAGLWPGWAFTLSGALWCLAFGGFVLIYGPLLWRPRSAPPG